MSGMNKIPNSDIIGYEGPVGFEKAVHKWQFQSLGAPWRKKRWSPADDPDWVYLGAGRWKYIPKETRETRRAGAED